MTVLVLGGTGFVGHSLVPMLREHGHQVRVLSRSSALPLRLAGQGVELLQGDLLSPSVLELELGQIDAMILLAAPRLFGKRLGNRRFRRLKAELTAIYSNALELAKRRGCPIIIAGGTSFRTVGDELADESWPIDRWEFAQELSRLLGAPEPKPVPSFIVKLVLGRRLFETASMNSKVSNAKLKRMLGWTPRYPSFREGLWATVEAIGRGEVTR